MSGQWSLFVDDKPWFGGRDLYMRVRQPRGGQGFIGRLTVTETVEGQPYDESLVALRQTREDKEDGIGDVDGFLQAALDVAWGLGMRPKAFTDHTNELSAVRYHLEDMRALAKVPPRQRDKP